MERRHERQKQQTAAQRKQQRFDRSKRGKSARRVGYSLERDCVNFLREKGIFAIRIASRAQTGNLRPIDVVACPRDSKPEFIQAKRRLKYLKAEEILRLKMVCTQFGAVPVVCWRDNGIHFKRLDQ